MDDEDPVRNPGEEALGIVLRDHEREAIRAFVGSHHEVDDGLAIGVDRAAVDLEAAGDEGGGEAELVEELEGATPDDEGF